MLIWKKVAVDVREFQNLEPGAIYYEIAIVLESKIWGFYITMCEHLGFNIDLHSSTLWLPLWANHAINPGKALPELKGTYHISSSFICWAVDFQIRW